jgi:hypothetical protein
VLVQPQLEDLETKGGSFRTGLLLVTTEKVSAVSFLGKVTEWQICSMLSSGFQHYFGIAFRVHLHCWMTTGQLSLQKLSAVPFPGEEAQGTVKNLLKSLCIGE